MGQKRNRSTNWSEEEKQLFRTVLKEYAQIIENKSLDTNTNKIKNKAWEELHKKFNQLNLRPRELSQLKIQWKVMKLNARKATFKKQMHQTGGGVRPETPSMEIIEVKDLLNPGELLRDHNIYDSDGIIIGEISNETCPKLENKKLEIDTFDDTNKENKEVFSTSIEIETIEDVDAQVTEQESTPSMMPQVNAPTVNKKETLKKRGVVQSTNASLKKRKINLKTTVGLKSRKDQEDYVNTMINHSKILKEKEHERMMEIAEEEHAIKMKIHEEKLKSAVLEREILELRKMRKTSASSSQNKIIL